MKRLTAAALPAAAPAAAALLAASPASAEPGDQCLPPVWAHQGLIFGTRQTCWYPDGSYSI
jgi:hypothetical protein